MPSDGFIAEFSDHVDTSCLTPHGIGLEMVQSALKWVREQRSIDLATVLTSDAVNSVARSLTESD